MLLSYDELLKDVLATGVLTPVPLENVNQTSIDVTLGRVLQSEDTPLSRFGVDLGKREALAMIEHFMDGPQGWLLEPGQFILAHTAEMFDMPLDLSAEFRLKSSAARMGLSHALAVWIDPGFHGSTLTLELHNISRYHTIRLRAGDKIGQIIFHRHAPVPAKESYGVRGAYNNDKSASPTKPELHQSEGTFRLL